MLQIGTLFLEGMGIFGTIQIEDVLYILHFFFMSKLQVKWSLLVLMLHSTV